MLKRFQLFSVSLDILLFALSVALLTYLAQTSQWLIFTIASLATILLYAILQYSKAKPILDRLDSLHAQQHLWVQKTQEVGIVSIFNMQDSEQQLERNRATAEMIKRGNVFNLLALSATSYIDPGTKRHWDILRPRIERGAPFRILLMNPFCHEKHVRDELNYGSIPFDPRFRFDLLYDLYNRYTNADIKITSLNIYCTLFFTEEEMIYDPYHLGKIGDRLENNFFAFRFKNISTTSSHIGSHDYYDILKKHFEYLWLTAEGFEGFLQNHKNEIQNTQFKSLEIHARLRS